MIVKRLFLMNSLLGNLGKFMGGGSTVKIIFMPITGFISFK